MTSIIPMTSRLSKQAKVQSNKNRCLIDDSVISEEPVVKTYENLIPSLPKFDIHYDDDEETNDAKSFKNVKVNRFSDNNYVLSEEKVLYQGMVKRKTVLKEGKKPSVSFQHFCPLVRSFGFFLIRDGQARLALMGMGGGSY